MLRRSPPAPVHRLTRTSVPAMVLPWVPGPGCRSGGRAKGPVVSLDSRGHSVARSLGRAGQAVSATAPCLPAAAREGGADGQGGGSDPGTFSRVNGSLPAEGDG